MILNDFTAPRERFSREKLDAVLVELCGMVDQAQRSDPDYWGMVAAAVLDPRGRLATGVNYVKGDGRVHAERAAIDNYEEEYGELPRGCVVITTLSPCSQDTKDNRHGESCTDLLNSKRVKMAYCGYKDPTQEDRNDFAEVVSSDSEIQRMCKQLADTFLKENFADGKKPGRKGLAKRSGVNTKASVSSLRKTAKNSSGEKQRMAHWMANMKAGKAKKKKTNEVITNPNIPSKGSDTTNLVNQGKPVPPGQEQQLLGTRVGRIGSAEVYRFDEGGDAAYSVFDPATRVSQLTVSGRNKAHSFEIFGVYAGSASPVKAADLYAWLVKNLGLTLVSDRQQSPGGQRVWQQLEQRYGRSVNVYAFNMKTNQPINTGADDPESTQGASIRLVAAPK